MTLWQVIREVVEKETVSPDSVKQLWLSSKQVHKAYLKLKQDLDTRMADLQQLLKQVQPTWYTGRDVHKQIIQTKHH